jgi:hypothetical protein
VIEDGGEEVVLGREDVWGVSLVCPVSGEEVDVGEHGEDPGWIKQLLGATHHHDLSAELAVRLCHRPAFEALVVALARTPFEAAAAGSPVSPALQTLEYSSLNGAIRLNAYMFSVIPPPL